MTPSRPASSTDPSTDSLLPLFFAISLGVAAAFATALAGLGFAAAALAYTAAGLAGLVAPGLLAGAAAVLRRAMPARAPVPRWRHG
jgi:hypothetical protein